MEATHLKLTPAYGLLQNVSVEGKELNSTQAKRQSIVADKLLQLLPKPIIIV